jgi:hypothetical protein
MSLSYKTVLELQDNYTIDQLNQAYWNKINKFSSNNLSDIDKHIYVETLKRYYDLAVDELHRRRFFNFDIDLMGLIRLNNIKESLSSQVLSQQATQEKQSSSSNTIYSSSTSYKEKLMPDGSKIVLNESVSNNNGEVTKNTNSYRRLANGATEPLEFNEALKQMENKLYLV